MTRTTRDDMDRLVAMINRKAGTAPTPYTVGADGQHHGNAGNYHIDGAYGGWKLSRICADGHGTENVLNCGYTTKRDLHRLMSAYLDGMGAA